MKIQYIISILIISIVIIMIIPVGVEEFKIKWNVEKQKVCLPWMPSGIVEAYEGNQHCSELQNIESQEFSDWYCNKKYPCIAKSESKMKKLYYEWENRSSNVQKTKEEEENEQ